MSDYDLPLFAWQPPLCEVRVFPLHRRASKVRDVAGKLMTKTTEAHVDQYTGQVTDALRRQLARYGLASERQASEIALFWSKVNLEVARLSLRGSTGNHPRGAA